METWERESLHQKLRDRDGVPPRPKGMAIAMKKDAGRETARSQGSTGIKPVRPHKPKPAPVIDELGIAVADHAVNGLPNHKIAEKLGVPLLQVEMARKLAPVRSRIKQLQIERTCDRLRRFDRHIWRFYIHAGEQEPVTFLCILS